MAADYAWRPTPAFANSCNATKFAKRQGLTSVDELRGRSIADIAWFWDAVVKDLPIDFFEPYSRVLDSSGGIPWTRWFGGGTLNVAHNCVDRHAKSGRATKVALIAESEEGDCQTLTYGQIYERTNQLANGLKSLGIGRGDRVGLMLPMIPEVVISLMAIAKIGAIALPIFSGFGASAVADRLKDSGATLLITADTFRRKGKEIFLKRVADEAVSASPSVMKVVVFGRTSGEMGVRDISAESLTRNQPSVCETEAMDAEDPFLICYTSGTTGRPKGAVHVHGGFLVKIAQEVAHQADLRSDDVLYWFTDMGWIMGPWEIVGGMALGGTVFLYEGSPDYPDPGRIWAQVERHKVSILGVSPTLVRSLMKHGDEPVKRHDLSSLRILGSTGEPWNPDPWQWYYDTIGGGRCPVINFSGGTEVGACLLSPLPCEPIKICSLGGPSLGMDVDVFDADGRSLRGGVGELVCKQPWPGMTRGLWGDPERYLETYWSRWPDVWSHGDWATVDADGQWFLHGRSDDTIKVAGKRIGPAEIESVIVSHPAVAESAAIGLPHEVKGEAIHVFLILNPGYAGDAVLIQEIHDLAADALGKSFAPEGIFFVADLPRTRSAKIVRRAIRAAALGSNFVDVSSLENPDALRAIRAMVAPTD